MTERTILEPGKEAGESECGHEAQEIEPITDEEILIALMAMDL